MQARVEYLIIGAGINGLLLARNLSKAGKAVLLVDKAEPGCESSWAGGGIISPLYPWRYPAPVTALASWAQDYYPHLAADLLAETGIDVQCRASGLLMLDAADRSEAVHWARQHGRVLEELSAREIYQREPGLAAGFSDGLWMPRIANIRNPRLCRALRQSLEQDPLVEIRCESEVTGFATGGHCVNAVHIKDGESQTGYQQEASRVIITAGAWSGLLSEHLGLTIDVHPVKGQMLLYKFSCAPVSSIILSAGRYLIPRADGHLLVGSTLEYRGFDKQPSTEAARSLRESAYTMLPLLRETDPVAQWAGLRPGSGDGIPFIGRVASFDNLYINAGQFRNGLVLAPASAQLLKNILLDEEPVVDPAPYDPRRSRLKEETATF